MRRLLPFKLSKPAFKSCIASILTILWVSSQAYAQKPGAFPVAVPETEGVSSAGIDSFVYAADRFHELHSFMVLRHDKIVAQGWWNPYGPALRHSMYSCSKSFTSTAVGFAVSEHKLNINDKVISFFPKILPDGVSPYLAQLTVRDLLTMSVGQETDPTQIIPFASDNWVKAFLARPIKYKPGTKFLYNTIATYVLSAIVQKVTGQRVFDYLKPRLFDPLGIKGIDWEVSDEGINTGGWGLRLKTEDMAKMGELYLHGGMWNGKQLLPKEWVNEATTYKIDQAPGVAQSKRDSSDWMQGYCYQFWRCRNNAFRGDGAFGQFIIMMPDEDAVVVMTAETGDMQAELNLVWKYLLPAMHKDALPADPTSFTNLGKHLAGLALPPLVNADTQAGIAAQKFSILPNVLGIKSISFRMVNGICRMVLEKDSALYAFNFATGKWLLGTTDMQGPSNLAYAKEDFSFLKPYKIAGSYGWQDGQTLQFKLRYIESPHSEIITCHFTNNKLVADIEYSNQGNKKIELAGDLMR
jgi:CubicO group peptidase (beta-lactamase class C family)